MALLCRGKDDVLHVRRIALSSLLVPFAGRPLGRLEIWMSGGDVGALVSATKQIDGSSHGPLSDLTFGAKDLFDIQGHTSSFGHPTWRQTHSPSKSTSPTIHRALEAGASLVGITKMDQLAYSLIGNVGEGTPPRNVQDDELFCGGSSSGSAALVAGDLADFAFGTDTAGSIRVPAAACGLQSLRPTHNVIDPQGVTPLAESFDVVGILSKRASVIRRVMDIIAPTQTPSPSVAGVQIATDTFAKTDEDTARAGRGVAELVAQAAGVPLSNIALERFTNTDVGGLFARLQGREIWANHSAWIEAHGSTLAPDVRSRLDRCKALAGDSPVEQREDREQRQSYRHEFEKLVPPGTVLVVPVMPRHGPKRSWDAEMLTDFRGGCFRLTAPSSLTGCPQAVLSVRSTRDERSIGIGLLAAKGDDRLLLDVMKQVSNEALSVSV